MIYFMDLEASSLMPGGFPIEIAWVDETGHGESYLIRPADVWLDDDRDHPNWSWQSEQVHGIRLSPSSRRAFPTTSLRGVLRRCWCRLPLSSAQTASSSTVDGWSGCSKPRMGPPPFGSPTSSRFTGWPAAPCLDSSHRREANIGQGVKKWCGGSLGKSSPPPKRRKTGGRGYDTARWRMPSAYGELGGRSAPRSASNSP
jgi:hypothetical protein